MNVTATKRPLALASAAALLGLALSACGGGASDAPDDASEKEFCAVVNDDYQDGVEDDDFGAQADAVRDWAEDLEEVGTPKGIPDDARKGFEIQVDALGDLDSDDLEKARDDEDFLADEFSDDDNDDIGAFVKYQIETCSDTETDSSDR